MAGGWQGGGKSKIVDSDGNEVSAQFPLATDGDSVYCKDINEADSSIGDFTGEICELFADYTNSQVAAAVGAGGANPKGFTIRLERPIISSVIGFGSPDTSLSNGKVLLKGIDGGTLREVDQSADSTKRGVMFFSFEQTAFIEVEVSFATADEVTIGGAYIPKSNYVTIGAIDGLIPIEASTTTPLGGGVAYTSGTLDTKNYGIIVVSVYSDEASATDGLSIQFSTDKTNWRWTDEYTIAAATGKTFSVQPQARYMRIVYTNGGTIQTVFDLQTQLKPVYIKPSSHRIADPISGQDDAELVKAVITGENPAGTYVNFQSTTAGNFKMSVEEFDDETNPIRKDMEGGGPIAVGTTKVFASFMGTPTKGIIITAGHLNTGILYIGKNDITNLGANALTFIEAGESVTISYEDETNPVYVVSDTAGQIFLKGALL